MTPSPISFYKASRHDKTLVTVSGPQLREAGIPAPLEKNATIILTLCHMVDGEERQTPIEFRVNRAPGKTLCSHKWPEGLPRPECGNKDAGIESQRVTVPVLYLEDAAKPEETATPVEDYSPTEADAELVS